MSVQSIPGTINDNRIHINEINKTNNNIDKDSVELAGKLAYLYLEKLI